MAKKPSADHNEKGQSIITKEFLRRLCEYNQTYETPKLNTHLYLHYMGFIDIRNLDEYINLRALWLENNMIQEIENLSCLTKLRFLYLQNNSITKIENLDSLKELTALNLSHNHITIIENLSSLAILEDFDISHNKIQYSYSIKGLKDVPSLKALDMRDNQIEDSEFLLETLQSLPELRCLVLKGNKCLKNIPNFRKSFVANLKNLSFFEEKMISEVERLACDAWLTDGKDAEMQIRKKYFEAKEAANKKSLEEFGEYEKISMQKQEEKKKKIIEERENERIKIVQERKKLLDGQFGDVEKKLKELNEKEKVLNEPIDESELVEFYLKPGKVVYQTGDFDHFGNKIDESLLKSKCLLKDVSELGPIALEELLILNEFSFEKVWEVLSHDYNCTTDSLRNYWIEYVGDLERYEELE